MVALKHFSGTHATTVAALFREAELCRLDSGQIDLIRAKLEP